MQVIDLQSGDPRLGSLNEDGSYATIPPVDVFGDASHFGLTCSLHTLPGNTFVLVPFNADESQLLIRLVEPEPTPIEEVPEPISVEPVAVEEVTEPEPTDEPARTGIDAVAEALGKSRRGKR